MHVQQGDMAEMKVTLAGAQKECPSITRDDMYNFLRRIKASGMSSLIITVPVAGLWAGNAPNVLPIPTKSGESGLISVANAVMAVREKRMSRSDAAAACSLPKETFRVRLLDRHNGPRGQPNKCGGDFVDHLVDYIDALRTTFKMQVFTFQVQQHAQHMIEGDI